MRDVEDGLHRMLMRYAGQKLPAQATSEPAPERDPLLHDLTLAEVHGRISPLHISRTQPALPTQGFGSYVGQFRSTTSFLEHTVPGMLTYKPSIEAQVPKPDIPTLRMGRDAIATRNISQGRNWRPVAGRIVQEL